jgi:uncharacterized membrane-anchored protein YitT (DUF2179 family)
MNPKIISLLDQHCTDLDKINKQRRAWLYASSVVFVGIIFLIFSWDWLDHFHQSSIWWVVISLMLILSINWWYWTMRVVKVLLCHQQIAQSLLKAVLEDVHEAKQNIKRLANQEVDNPK